MCDVGHLAKTAILMIAGQGRSGQSGASSSRIDPRGAAPREELAVWSRHVVERIKVEAVWFFARVPQMAS
jgi:hypothetical protein